jgi:peptidoglycan/LPS O-acetylase OafA/YrhL
MGVILWHSFPGRRHSAGLRHHRFRCPHPHKSLKLRTDLSYGVYIYAFPIQQLLVICGLGVMNPIVFAIIAAIATLPLAALSWVLVEKRAMSLKSRLLGLGQ